MTGHVLTSSPHSLLLHTLISETRTLVLSGPAMETGQSEGQQATAEVGLGRARGLDREVS